MGKPTAHRILIVDQDRTMLALIERVLLRHGYHSTGLDDGPSAVTRIANDPPDLAIVDYGLSGPMDGLELVAALRRRHPTVPALFTSAFGSAELYQRARACGATDCLSKPFHMTTFVQRIETLLALPAAREKRSDSENYNIS